MGVNLDRLDELPALQRLQNLLQARVLQITLRSNVPDPDPRRGGLLYDLVHKPLLLL